MHEHDFTTTFRSSRLHFAPYVRWNSLLARCAIHDSNLALAASKSFLLESFCRILSKIRARGGLREIGWVISMKFKPDRAGYSYESV